MYFEIYQDAQNALASAFGTKGQWRWRLKGGNHEIVAQGESYASKQGCLNAVGLVQSTTTATPIKEV